MAYTLTQTELALFQHPYRQICTISGNSLDVSEKDIVSGTMNINRYCVSGNGIEVGSVVASELKFTLDNSDGRFNGVSFQGMEIHVTVGTKKWDASEGEVSDFVYCPMGYFIIDNNPKSLAQIEITALDRMVLFDKPIDLSIMTYPITVQNMVTQICEICGVTLKTNLSTLPNYNYNIRSIPTDSELTYRQILAWCCEIMGVCAFMDYDGQLVCKWYSATSGFTRQITTSNRYSSEIGDLTAVSGVKVVSNETEYIGGSDGYLLLIEGNSLIQHDEQEIADILGRNRNTSFYPFNAVTMPFPDLYPLDMVAFVSGSNTLNVYITNITFTLNQSTYMEGKCLTQTESTRARQNPLTARERAVIQNTESIVEEHFGDKITNALAFSELISNAIGMYVTPVEQPEGGTVYYMHNRPNLSESMTIFVMTADGIAWTDSGWNGGSPVWSYGATGSGDALFRMLSAEGIRVSSADNDYHIEITPSTFEIYYKDMVVTQITADEMQIPNLNITNYAQVGKVRIVPYKVGNSELGANVIYVD